MERVFTFGFGHRHPVTDISLARAFIVIQGTDSDDCRRQMWQKFGNQWSMEYPTREAAGVDEFGLWEIQE